MLFKKIFACLLTTAGFVVSQACTTFLINHNGQLVFGRNYDWLADAGMVCTNLKGLSKTSFENEDGGTISWVSQYGSISFNQYGKEMPTGGMNEKGLVVELMWLDETKYPKEDQRPAIGVLQWIQYQLDNCSTVAEVIATDKKLRITNTSSPLHYLVADAAGHAATIEFLDGKIQVHQERSLPFPVLTNHTYEQSLHSKGNGSYAGNNSLERFATACNRIEQYKKTPGSRSLIDESFDILGEVAQGNYTKWSIVYDISNKKIYWKTQQYRQQRSVSFAFFDFSCKTASKTIDINTAKPGDISRFLTDLTPAFSRQIFEKTLEQSRSRIVLTPARKEAVLAYAAAINCK